MAEIAKTFTIASRGVGRPDYAATFLEEPWIATYPDRLNTTIGWIFTSFQLNFALPAKTFTPFSTWTAAEVEATGLETVLFEFWIASSPNVYCQCYMGTQMVCSPIGCSPALCFAGRLQDNSLPISTHIYNTETGRYGIVCRFRKDIGRGYSMEHGLYNDEVIDQTCEVAAVSYQRRITVT